MGDRVNVPALKLLEVLSDEMTQLSLIAERLQTIMLIACSGLTGRDSLMSDAQACDMLTQKLSATAGFLSDAARSVPTEWEVDLTEAIGRLDLSELVLTYSLRGPSAKAASPGSIDIFDG